jgi:hypothetical protein
MGFGDVLKRRAGSAVADSLFGSSEKKAAEAQVGAEKEILEAHAKQSETETIMNTRFEGSGDDIATDLNTLLTMYKQLPSGWDASPKDKQTKAAILEKLEFGIMKLRKQDADTAEFFQKKFDEISKKKK